MIKILLLPKFLCLIFLSVFFLNSGGVAAGAEEGIYQSRFATIHYHDAGALQDFSRKIQPGTLGRTLNRIFLRTKNGFSEGRLGGFVDGLFQRVQAILDMPQPRLRVHIRLHQDQEALSEAFARITGRPTKDPAFYWKKTNTIYLQTERLSIGMLTHEMAHAVIEHYFAVRPPPKIAELLCQYAERQISLNGFTQPPERNANLKLKPRPELSKINNQYP